MLQQGPQRGLFYLWKCLFIALFWRTKGVPLDLLKCFINRYIYRQNKTNLGPQERLPHTNNPAHSSARKLQQGATCISLGPAKDYSGVQHTWSNYFALFLANKLFWTPNRLIINWFGPDSNQYVPEKAYFLCEEKQPRPKLKLSLWK